jgi:hypothetical protein
MNCAKLPRLLSILVVFLVCVGSAHAEDISGTISSTKVISADSRLVGDVTYGHSDPCISFGALA